MVDPVITAVECYEHHHVMVLTQSRQGMPFWSLPRQGIPGPPIPAPNGLDCVTAGHYPEVGCWSVSTYTAVFTQNVIVDVYFCGNFS